MLSLQECFDLSDLSEDEIEVIAEHEHVPPIVAAELGTTLLKTKTGLCLLRLYLLESIERARETGDFAKARRLDEIYSRLENEHTAPPVLQ